MPPRQRALPPVRGDGKAERNGPRPPSGRSCCRRRRDTRPTHRSTQISSIGTLRDRDCSHRSDACRLQLRVMCFTARLGGARSAARRPRLEPRRPNRYALRSGLSLPQRTLEYALGRDSSRGGHPCKRYLRRRALHSLFVALRHAKNSFMLASERSLPPNQIGRRQMRSLATMR